jgi:hypothetical protein
MVEAWYDPTNHVVSTDKHDPRFTSLGQLLKLGENQMKYVEDTSVREQAMTFALQLASIERKYANSGDVLRIAQQFYEWLSCEKS